MDKEINKMPLVSIVIPSYNKAELLIEMIKCIIKQTYTNWELIIVDDGSDDEEYEKIHKFVSLDNRCIHIKRDREPKNGNTCRNIGIEMSKGKYLIIFDSDDLISHGCIETRVKYMQSHPEYDYVTFPYTVFYNGVVDSEKEKKFFYEVKEKDILSSLLKTDYPFTVWSNIYKRESLKNIKWDEKVFVYQDFDFMVSCALAKIHHGYCNAAIDYYYRQFSDGSNVCGNFVSKEKCESTLYLFDKILKCIEKQDDSCLLKNDFKDFIMIQIERLMSENQKKDADKFTEMLSSYYSNFFIYRLKIAYNIAYRFSSFCIRRNILFSLYIILFQSRRYLNRFYNHYNIR